MKKILIVCQNNDTVKKIVNKTLYNLEEIRIVGIANTLEESKKLINDLQPDIIITTNANIIKLVKECFITTIHIIVFFNNNSIIDLGYKNLLMLNYNLNFKEINIQIKDYIKNNILYSKKQKAIHILTQLGFDFKLSGTTYILDSILYSSNLSNKESFDKLYKDIYSHIAKIHHTSVDRVKWSIARSINYMYDKHTLSSYKIVERYFGIEYPKKPTPKLVINYISNCLTI